MYNFFKKFFSKKEQKKPVEEIVQSLAGSVTQYLFNDPTTPNLMSTVTVPTKSTNLPFSVSGFNGTNGILGTVNGQAANCQVTICNSIACIQKYVSRFRQPLKSWATGRILAVTPRAGRDLNAYYDRIGLRFFYDTDEKTNNVVYTSNSADIVAHELGHAILDSLRPDFWSVQNLEIWAFHEAFGDILALLNAMNSTQMMNHALTETSGNLAASNCITRLAEELGVAIYNLAGAPYYTNSLRDASISFDYVDPKKLPADASYDKLSKESHSFSRIFTSAWYKMFVGMYNQEVSQGKTQANAFAIARDAAGYYLLKSIPQAPRTVYFFDAIAKGIIAADKLNGSKYASIISSVFTQRKILRQGIKMLSNKTWPEIKNQIDASDVVVNTRNLILVRKNFTKTIKLSDHLVSGLSVKPNPLNNLEIEIPLESYYEFNSYGELTEEIHTDFDESVEVAAQCVKMIETSPIVRKMWDIKNNKLVRNHIKCCGLASHCHQI